MGLPITATAPLLAGIPQVTTLKGFEALLGAQGDASLSAEETSRLASLALVAKSGGLFAARRFAPTPAEALSYRQPVPTTPPRRLYAGFETAAAPPAARGPAAPKSPAAHRLRQECEKKFARIVSVFGPKTTQICRTQHRQKKISDEALERFAALGVALQNARDWTGAIPEKQLKAVIARTLRRLAEDPAYAAADAWGSLCDRTRRLGLSPTQALGLWELFVRFGWERTIGLLTYEAGRNLGDLKKILDAFYILFNSLEENKPLHRIGHLFDGICGNARMRNGGTYNPIGFIFQLLLTAAMIREGMRLADLEQKVVLGGIRFPRISQTGDLRFERLPSFYFFEDLLMKDPGTGARISVEIKTAMQKPVDLDLQSRPENEKQRKELYGKNHALLAAVLTMRRLEGIRQRDKSILAVIGPRGITERTVQTLIGLHPMLEIRVYDNRLQNGYTAYLKTIDSTPTIGVFRKEGGRGSFELKGKLPFADFSSDPLFRGAFERR